MKAKIDIVSLIARDKWDKSLNNKQILNLFLRLKLKDLSIPMYNFMPRDQFQTNVRTRNTTTSRVYFRVSD